MAQGRSFPFVISLLWASAVALPTATFGATDVDGATAAREHIAYAPYLELWEVRTDGAEEKLEWRKESLGPGAIRIDSRHTLRAAVKMSKDVLERFDAARLQTICLRLLSGGTTVSRQLSRSVEPYSFNLGRVALARDSDHIAVSTTIGTCAHPNDAPLGAFDIVVSTDDDTVREEAAKKTRSAALKQLLSLSIFEWREFKGSKTFQTVGVTGTGSRLQIDQSARVLPFIPKRPSGAEHAVVKLLKAAEIALVCVRLATKAGGKAAQEETSGDVNVVIATDELGNGVEIGTGIPPHDKEYVANVTLSEGDCTDDKPAVLYSTAVTFEPVDFGISPSVRDAVLGIRTSLGDITGPSRFDRRQQFPLLAITLYLYDKDRKYAWRGNVRRSIGLTFTRGVAIAPEGFIDGKKREAYLAGISVAPASLIADGFERVAFVGFGRMLNAPDGVRPWCIYAGISVDEVAKFLK